MSRPHRIKEDARNYRHFDSDPNLSSVSQKALEYSGRGLINAAKNELSDHQIGARPHFSAQVLDIRGVWGGKRMALRVASGGHCRIAGQQCAGTLDQFDDRGYCTWGAWLNRKLK